MEDEEKSPQQTVKEAIWTYTGWAVIILACIGAGVFIGYEAWGDAPHLRKRVDQLEKQVLELKNNRESLQTQVAMATRDRDECHKALQAAGQKVPPPSEQAAPGEAPVPAAPGGQPPPAQVE